MADDNATTSAGHGAPVGTCEVRGRRRCRASPGTGTASQPTAQPRAPGASHCTKSVSPRARIPRALPVPNS